MPRVAVVDDSETTLAWARRSLPPHGFEVFTRNTALGVRAFLHNVRADLVLLDVKMPALDGATVCSMIKRHELTKNLIVVLFSSEPEETLIELQATSGADGYITKSEDDGALVKKLRRFLSSKVLVPKG